jgi:aquaporin Z
MVSETKPRQSEQSNKQSAADDKNRPFSELRCILAELVGTFALTFVGAGGAVIAAVTNGAVSDAARFVVPGLLIMAMTYSFGNLSGAHFNPVVTLSFALRRDFQWSRVPGYWAAQFVGAILAALLLLVLFGPVKHLGAPEPHYGILTSLVLEVVLTFFLITVILATATNHSLVGPTAALAVGGTIVLDGLFAGPISGAAMNPALALGPYFVSGQLSDAWIYVVGPVLGGLSAFGIAWLLHGGTTEDEVNTAGGK